MVDSDHRLKERTKEDKNGERKFKVCVSMCILKSQRTGDIRFTEGLRR